jgi:hypothetical protein
VCSAIFWAWSAIKQKLWANRRKSRDDEKPRHGSGRRGSYRVPSALGNPMMDAFSCSIQKMLVAFLCSHKLAACSYRCI